jgi:hypothetical protein
MSKQENGKNKPTIETLINTTAVVLSSLGTQVITKGEYQGYIMIAFAMSLEFFKYWGRKKKLW